MKSVLSEIRSTFAASLSRTTSKLVKDRTVLRGKSLFDTHITPYAPQTKGKGKSKGKGQQNAKCSDPHWSYQCNSAMSVFSKVRGLSGAPSSPRELAAEIVRDVKQHNDGAIVDLSVAGPGFINIALDPAYFERRLELIAKEGLAPPESIQANLKVIVDFSSPNIAKDMHVGHLRSTIIGDSLCRVLEFVGHRVERLNHVGDWGTQFGMLLAYLCSHPTTDLQISSLHKMYKKSKELFDTNADFKKQAYQQVVMLQAGDAKAIQMWQAICTVSRTQFEGIYSRLGIKIKERGESSYNEQLPELVQEFQERGLAKVTDGAVCSFPPTNAAIGSTSTDNDSNDSNDSNDGQTNSHIERSKVPLILQKTDGGYTYDTTDMAAIKHRLLNDKADWLVYVTDAGQRTHFELVFSAAKEAGWIKDKHRITHVGFGVVVGEDGKKFKSRSGDAVKLVDLLDEAVVRTERVMVEAMNLKDNERPPPESVEKLAFAAVKYADLRRHRTTDYCFSFDTMLDLRGDTAVYLNYTYSRLLAILVRSERNGGFVASDGVGGVGGVGGVSCSGHGGGGGSSSGSGDSISSTEWMAQELQLADQVTRFHQVIEDVYRDMCPHLLCGYMHDVAKRANEFYEHCPVIGAEETVRNRRLLLCKATTVVMQKCFGLLGMELASRM